MQQSFSQHPDDTREIMFDRIDQARVTIGLPDFYGKELNTVRFTCNIEPNATRRIATLSLTDLLGNRQKNEVILTLRIKHRSKLLFDDYKFLTVPKELNLPQPHLTQTVETTPQGITLTLPTDFLAKDVFTEIPTQGADLSDNVFDLLPGQRKVVTIDGAGIRIRTLTDTYEGDTK